MPTVITVPATVREKTHIGKVEFPADVPNGLASLIKLPDDLQNWAHRLGLDEKAVRFILGATRGLASVTAGLNLPDLAPRLGLSFDEVDAIVRDLIAKNYARMDDRLDLYRLWVVILHLKGTRFAEE